MILNCGDIEKWEDSKIMGADQKTNLSAIPRSLGKTLDSSECPAILTTTTAPLGMGRSTSIILHF